MNNTTATDREAAQREIALAAQSMDSAMANLGQTLAITTRNQELSYLINMPFGVAYIFDSLRRVREDAKALLVVVSAPDGEAS